MKKLINIFAIVTIFLFSFGMNVSAADVIDYTYTGGFQEFTVPEDGYYKFELWGASGGKNIADGSYTNSYVRVPGYGGYTTGTAFLRKGTLLYVYVGGKGVDAKSGRIVSGGWNGGGKGDYDREDDEASGGGGGATDIRLVKGTPWSDFDSLKSRVLVAAGGGGASYQAIGGYGGGLVGGNSPYSEGATQTSGYGFGIGMDGKFVDQNVDVAGGGGGYYGGFANSSGKAYTYLASGAGGSSFASGCLGCNAIAENSTIANIIHTGTNKHYSGLVFKDITILAGNEVMPTFTTGTMTGNSSNGYARITKLEGKDAITGIKFGENEAYQHNEYDPYTYTIYLRKDESLTGDLTLEVMGEPISIIGEKNVDLKIGTTHRITMTSKTGEITVYNLEIKQQRAHIDYLNFDFLDIKFNPYVTNYSGDVEYYVKSLVPDIIKDDRVTVTVEGVNNLKTGENIIKITAHEDGYEDTVYEIKVNKGSYKLQDNESAYSYTGGAQVFEAPLTGYYELEAWGASGGRNIAQSSYTNVSVRDAGRGAYTKGRIYLEKGTKLHIYIGGKGSDAQVRSIVNGGYNGGGKGDYDHSDDEASGGGGGATDIRLEGGAWNNFASLKSRIMVAAGGGGASYQATGGNGGTLAGEDTLYSKGGTQTSGYAFGYAMDGKYVNSNVDVAGGGSGYFGGFANSSGKADVYLAAGAGGSSYVSGCEGCRAVNAGATATNLTFASSPNHHSGYVFDHIVMAAGNEEMPAQSGKGTMVGNSGHGFAKITYVGDTAIVDLDVEGAVVTDVISLENDNFNVLIPTPEFETNIKVETNQSVTIIGDGRVTLKEGEKHNIVLMDEVGNVKVYTITPYTEKPTLRKISFKETTFSFSPNIFEYTIKVPNEVGALTPEVLKHENISYTIAAELDSKGLIVLYVGENTITFNVTDEIGSKSEYVFHVIREYKNQNMSFSSVGAHEYVVPDDGWYILEAWGAGGGKNRSQGRLNGSGGDGYAVLPGYGGYTRGEIFLERGTKLYIHVGGKGTDAATSTVVAGGYNGGGRGDWDHSNEGSGGEASGAGGGASDIRLVGGAWNDFESLKSRIMVAAGGGGASYGEPGGHAGGLSGKSTLYSAGATQTTGYSFGVGQDGIWVHSNVDVAGGGGGYYGGYAKSSANAVSSWRTAGAGGSSFVSGCTGCNAILESSTKTKVVHSGSTTHYSGKVFKNIVMKGGNEAMPTFANPSKNMTGNSGNGYVKITAIPNIADTKIISLSLDKGDMSPAFNENTYKYNVTIEDIDTVVNITARTNNTEALITGDGRVEIPTGTYVHNVSVTDETGAVKVYEFTFTRSANNFQYLEDILINGVSLEGFSSVRTVYNDIEIPYYLDFINVEAVTGTNQSVVGDGVIAFGDSDTAEAVLYVTSEDGKRRTPYFLNFVREKTSLLRDIKINTIGVKFTFDEDKREFELDVNESIFELDMEPIPYYKGATVTVDGADYIQDGSIITVTSHVDGLEDSVYTFKINHTNNAHVDDTFEAIGEPIAFAVPFKGYYKVELWGAAGGLGMVDGNLRNEGGEGAYTSGTILLERGETVYLYIGTKGQAAGSVKSCTGGPGGWNGGGTGGNDSNCDSAPEPGSGGGGATDLRIINGNPDNPASLRTRLMVAAGGSGGSYSTLGVAGGGLLGYRPTGSSSAIATQTAGYAQGLGASGSPAYAGSSGSSGGYYGGYNFSGGYYAGGSGSSYISGHLGSIGTREDGTKVANAGESVTDSYNYTGRFFTDTKMIDGYGYLWSNVKEVEELMPNPKGGYFDVGRGNPGDGAARIKLLQAISSNNFLDSLTVTTKEGEEIDLEFAPGKMKYEVDLLDYESIVKIGATPKDENATITNLGDHNIPPVNSLNPDGYSVIVSVTATDGSIRPYEIVFRRDPLTSPYPKEIKVNKMAKYICSLDSSTYCKYSFDVNKVDPEKYEIMVPFSISNVEILAIPETEYQPIVYSKVEDDGSLTALENGKVDLKSGVNKFEVEVFSEDENDSVVYLYEITRDPRGNTNLADIEVVKPVTDPKIDIDYQPDVYEYTIEVPSDCAEVEFNVTPEQNTPPDQTRIYISGNKNLRLGMNDAYITALAPNGESNSYIVHIYKKSDSNVYLESLVPNTGTLSPTFDKYINDYTLTVGSDVDAVNVAAVAESGGATVEINKPDKLESGVNTITITVKNGEGAEASENVYTVTVIKEKGSNPNLKSLTVDGYTIDEAFNPDTLEYHVTIPKDVTRLDVSAIPVDTATKVTIRGNKNLIYNTNEIVITCVAENKTKKVYYLYARKDVSDNNNLKDIVVKNGEEKLEITPEFAAGTLLYSLSVPSTVDSVDVEGIMEDEYAKIKGNGTYALATGNNVVSLVVTSELGSEKTYTVTITKEKSDDCSLKEIINNQNSEAVKTGDNEYSINVQYDVKSLDIKGIPNHDKAKVSGNGTYSLTTGDNKIYLSVTSESGKIATYTVNVVRDLSHNDDLAFLYALEGGLTPVFRSTTIYYDVYVPNDVEKLTLTVETEDKDATYEVIGNENFVVGENNVKVVVTAPDGKNVKEYHITVYRQEATEDALSLADLAVNPGTLKPEFDSSVYLYEVTVPYTASTVDVSASAVSDEDTVIGAGTYPLEVGKNGITIGVMNPEGIRKDYQVIVTRQPSDDATLANLVVKGHVISPAFYKNTFSYTLTTSNEKLEFLSIVPTLEDSTYEIVGNENFKSGENTVKIVVTPPSKNEAYKKEYVLKVTKNPSKNNNLASLEIKGFEVVPTFHKGVTVYTLTVPRDTNSVEILAKPEDEEANVRGAGLVKVESGVNEIPIVVTAEDGTQRVYNVVISREASDNNYLKTLLVSEGDLSPTFDKDISEYTVSVPYEIDEITLVGDTEEDGAKVTGLNTYPLNVGENKLKVVVTSESGIDREYFVNVTRDEMFSAYLSSLDVESYELNTEFDMEFFEYYIDVPNEIDTFSKIKINATPLMSSATVNIECTEDLVVGMNVATIKVTATKGEETKEQEYKLYINRQLSANNKLQELSIDGGTLDPVFSPDVLSYKVEVASDVKSIDFNALVADSNSTISSVTGSSSHTMGEGNHNVEGKVDLKYGDNVVRIKVKSMLGIIRTYSVTVNRAPSTNTSLSKLEVLYDDKALTMTPTFDKATTSYEVEVGENIKYVELKATPEDADTKVSGVGVKALTQERNTFEVKTTSVSGEELTYTVVVIRSMSSNNNVVNIKPSIGELVPAFDPAVKEYLVKAKDTDLFLSFDVEVEDASATITGHEEKAIIDGKSSRTIKVKAENGSENTYTINVQKESSSEARLQSLKIEGYDFEFDPDTFTYNIKVSHSKDKLLQSEITATPMDFNATVNMMGDLELSNDIINIYTIEVIARDGYTTEPYYLNITRDSADYSLISSVYNVKRTETLDYVIGLVSDTKVGDFKNNFDNEYAMLRVYKEDGVTLVEDENALVSTGMVVRLQGVDDDYLYDEARIILRGDLTKDGKVNLTDQIELIRYVGKISTFDQYQMLAGELTGDGKVNLTDQIQLIRYVGKLVKDLNEFDKPKTSEE